MSVNRKRCAAIALCVILLLAVFAGCGGGAQSLAESPAAGDTPQSTAESIAENAAETGEKIQMNFLTTSNEEWEKKYGLMLEDIMARNPNWEIQYNKVASTMTGIGWDGFNQKFLSLMAAGTPPDLVYAGVSFIPQYSSQGFLTELDPYIEAMDNKEDFTEGSLRLLEQPNGKVYAIGDGIGSIMMYYNKNLFDEAGLPYPPADYNNAITVEQFDEYARAISGGEGGNKVFGAYVNLTLERSTPMLFGFGGNVFNDDQTKCLLDSPESIECYTMLSKLILDGCAPNASQLKAIPQDQMFMTNKLGMYFGPPHDVAPLAAAAEETGLRFGVAATPKREKSETFLFLDGYGIPAGAAHPEESFKLITELLGVDAGRIANELANPSVIPLNAKLLDETREVMYSYLPEEEKNVWYDAPKHCSSFPFNPSWNKVVDVSMATFDIMAIGEISPEDGMKKITEEVDAILKSDNQ